MPTVGGILEAIRGLTPADRLRLVRELYGGLDETSASSPAPAAHELPGDLLVQDLRESERRLEEAQRIAHVGYWDRDFVSGRMTLSDEACRIFGFPPDARIVDLARWHRQWVSLIHAEDRARIAEALAEAVHGRTPYDVEYRIVRPSGDVRVIHSRAEVTWNETGAATRMYGMMLDITELRRAERARNASEARFRTIFEHAADGVILLDEQLQVIDVNRRACESLGFTRCELIGKAMRELNVGLDADGFQAVWNRLRSGAAVTFEMVRRRKDGSEVVVEVRSIQFDHDGPHYVSLVRDITERRQAEREVKALEEQLRQAQKLEAVGKLAGGIAHDFNNLLTVINGCVELSLERLAGQPGAELLIEVQQAGARAADLTRQLLAFSRRQVLHASAVDLNATLRRVGTMLRRVIGEDVELHVNADPTLGHVQVDDAQFEQAIVNLAVNARDAMPNGGRLDIQTRHVELDRTFAAARPELRPGTYAEVTVSDTGHGMDPATMAHVFEPFFTTKPVGQGTGLGLAMVYGFLKQSGGHVEVESTPGAGSTFRLYLPLAGTEANAAEVQAPAAAPAAARGTETVLLVEDEESVRRLCQQVLRAHGYTVLEAANGEEALVLATRGGSAIDILVTDLVMPRMGGRPLADRLRLEFPSLRVLLLTGYAENMPHEHELDPGTGVLQKPFLPAVLAGRVRSLLDSERLRG